jgi:hypothetical protein
VAESRLCLPTKKITYKQNTRFFFLSLQWNKEIEGQRWACHTGNPASTTDPRPGQPNRRSPWKLRHHVADSGSTPTILPFTIFGWTRMPRAPNHQTRCDHRSTGTAGPSLPRRKSVLATENRTSGRRPRTKRHLLLLRCWPTVDRILSLSLSLSLSVSLSPPISLFRSPTLSLCLTVSLWKERKRIEEERTKRREKWEDDSVYQQHFNFLVFIIFSWRVDWLLMGKKPMFYAKTGQEGLSILSANQIEKIWCRALGAGPWPLNLEPGGQSNRLVIRQQQLPIDWPKYVLDIN